MNRPSGRVWILFVLAWATQLGSITSIEVLNWREERSPRHNRPVLGACKTRALPVVMAAALCVSSCGGAGALSRVQQIRQRGFLVCGISPGIAGFAQADADGRYRGLDIDICRAVAAAIVGTADSVRYEQIASLEQLQRSPNIDLVSRRLTWSLRREGLNVLFGPIVFYDGQGFLVSRRVAVDRANQLADVPVCVAEGSEHDVTLTAYFRRQGLALRRVPVPDGRRAGDALMSGACDAFSADISELASLRSRLARPDDVRILADRISREPLAQLVRGTDVDLFDVLRWTVFATVSAEELGVTSANVDEMKTSADPDVRRLLGVARGNGAALGLDEGWAAAVIKEVGNYGEVFERNLGPNTPIKLERGLNGLWTAGGLMFAPPLR